jgi:8-oxo-dGTP pyrophosphatase MutT (NUDIX family)
MRSEADRRWALLNKTIRQAFIEHDLVGMRGVGRLPFADKSEGFAAWLRQELAHKVFGMDGRWLLPYVRHAAAIAQTHADNHAPGAKVDPLRIKMMENYAVNELRGIVEAAQQQIVRMVTHSIMAADPPTKAANALAPVFRTMRNRTRAMSEYVTAKTHATCTLSAFRNAGVTSVGIIPERHKLHDWGPEAWEASAEARRGRAKALARIARAEAWARRYNKKHPGPRPGDRPNAAVLGYSYSSENFGVDTEDARKKPLTPREAAELPWRGEQRVRVPISRPPWLQETENRPIEEVPSYEEVNIETAGDGFECEECLDLSEAGPYELDEAEDLIPAHPWSFLPGTRIQGDIIAALKAFYSGPAVEIRTSSGERLRVTINHPVMTNFGAVSAGNLREGMKLFRQRHVIRNTFVLGMADQNDNPLMIEEIFETLRGKGFVAVAPSADDLHGDARCVYGDVDIVCADRRLLRHLQASLGQSSSKFVFPKTDVFAEPRAVSGGSLRAFRERSSSAFRSSPSIAALTNDGRFSSQFYGEPLETFRSGTPANSNAIASQELTQDIALYSTFIGKLFERRAGAVSLDQLCSLTWLENAARAASITHFNAAAFKAAINHFARQAAFIRDLVDAGTFSVEHDEIIELRRFEYVGHIYDVQSTKGWIVTPETLCFQCRCAFVPAGRGSIHETDAKSLGSLVSQTSYVEDIEAAGVLFHTPTGHMLLMKRADTGQWSIPAGGLEGHEEPLQAAQRESAEETGNPGDHKAVKVDERTTSGVHFHTFAQPAEWQFAPILNPEHTEYGWFQRHDLPEPLHPGLAATMHAMSEGGVVPFADSV